MRQRNGMSMQNMENGMGNARGSMKKAGRCNGAGIFKNRFLNTFADNSENENNLEYGKGMGRGMGRMKGKGLFRKRLNKMDKDAVMMNNPDPSGPAGKGVSGKGGIRRRVRISWRISE